MKRLISILLSTLLVSIALCGCIESKSSEQNLETTGEIINDEESIVDNIGEREELKTVENVKNYIKAALTKVYGSEFSLEITDEKLENKDGKKTTTFKIFDGAISVSVIENESGLEQIMSWSIPSSFLPYMENDEIESIQMASMMCVLAVAGCDESNDNFELFTNITKNEPTEIDGVLYFTYIENEWEYSLSMSDVLITAAVKPLE